jgi:hypothetical protein
MDSDLSELSFDLRTRKNAAYEVPSLGSSGGGMPGMSGAWM